MITLSLADVAQAVGGTVAAGLDARIDVTADVVIDSRTVSAGGLFVAIRGEHSDGHDYAHAAIERGAAAVLSDHPLPAVPSIVVPDTVEALGKLAAEVLRRLRAAGPLEVVAVTGSAGKTTTKDLLGQVLSERGETIIPVASFNNELGVPLTVLRATAHTRTLVLEMGANHVGEIAQLTRIAPPDVAVVLMVGQAHVGEFGGIEAVARAKTELVTGLVPGGTSVLNADDSRVAAMAQVAPGPVVWFGTGPAAQVRGEDITTEPDGTTSFTLCGLDGQRATVHLNLVGQHHVHNALAAAAVANDLGMTTQQVATALTRAQRLSPHRMQVTHRPDGITVVDDSFNANPDSMRAALRTLAAMAGRTRRSVAVLGEMLELGSDSTVRHDEIGRLAVRLNIGVLVVVGAGARAMLQGAINEGSWGSEAVFAADLPAARELLATILMPGDVVLVKSSHGAGLWQLADDLSEGRIVPMQEVTK